jgi:hypothetical protein
MSEDNRCGRGSLSRPRRGRGKEGTVRYEDLQLDCPRCGEWVPVQEGSVTATCPYCWRLIPVPRRSRGTGLVRDLPGRLLGAVLSGLRRQRRECAVVACHLVSASLDRRPRGLLAEPGMGRGHELVLVGEPGISWQRRGGDRG